jgi:DNA-binding MarR family transcriptional regulator
MSALIESAAERGFIVRETYPGDRRRRRIALSGEGRRRVEAVPHLGREVATRMTTGFTDEERLALAVLLERAAQNLESQVAP